MKDQTLITYAQLKTIPAGTSTEELVDVRMYDSSIIAAYEKPDMRRFTGDTILVRDAVARKLAAVNADLAAKHDLRLKVVYGYRHPAIQEEYFTAMKETLATSHPELEDEEIDSLTHNLVAVPDVAGHPTGGAIDLTVVTRSGEPVDMGTGIADYADTARVRTYAEGLTPRQQQNRALLHDALVAENFAPFYGEWWHFSYGDKEWAFFYDTPAALYGPLRIETI